MKKIYIYIGCAIIVISTACMEQRPKLFSEAAYDDYSTDIPLAVVNQKKLTMMPIPLQVNQGDWQKLNAIANMTYKKEETKNQFNRSPIDNLNPIYRPIENFDKDIRYKKLQSNEEQQTFLQKTVNVEPNIEQVDTLYRIVQTLISQKGSVNYHVLTGFLNSYNKKNNNICEDVIGKAIYNSYNTSIKIKYKVALFFSCLKKYFLTIDKIKENIPSTDDVAQWEGLTCYAVNKTDNGAAQQFPAYFALADFLWSISRYKGSATTLCTCFYANENIVFEGYSHEDISSKNDLSHKFYSLAYSLIVNNGSILDIYILLCMIENAKKLKIITNEYDLVKIVREYDPTDTIIGKARNWWNSEYITLHTKNRLASFCSLIKEYSQKCGNKTTPTGNQYILYNMIKGLNLAFPDSFNSSIFDDNCYAFTEFKQLINDIKKLM